MLKVIFLDIDGTLNSGNYIISLNGAFDIPKNQMDPKAVSRLNTITDITGAQIVVSSTWRINFISSDDPLRQLKACMKAYKITAPVIGMTPIKYNAIRNRRGKEIQAWMDDHYNDIEKYIIIDDDSDMGKLGKDKRFIKTLFKDGLQDEHVQLAIEILGKK